MKNELKNERRTGQDSNLWPPDYKTNVLPQSYVGLLPESSIFLQYVTKNESKIRKPAKKC